MTRLTDTFTSTGSKFFAHQEAMTKLANGQGQPITTHVMLTDICNHSCAFCSVQARVGDSLPFWDVLGYIDILQRYGLKSVILSGGGNPILYKCKKTGQDFNDVVSTLSDRGLEIGLITNGIPLKSGWDHTVNADVSKRMSWKTVRPSTLDKLTWIRISMSGLDHEENEVYVPDIDPFKTTLGFSYVCHDIYDEPEDPHHGKVSRPLDIISGNKNRSPDRYFEERMDDLIEKITDYVKNYKPRYVRLLPNCLEPELISQRVRMIEMMAKQINWAVNREVAFVQNKPPKAPKACYLGYVHPVLNTCGGIFPCDSCVLNEEAGHKFSNPWRICHWSEVAKLYEQPIHSLIKDPSVLCPGCVFTAQNKILGDVVEGRVSIGIPQGKIDHINFV